MTRPKTRTVRPDELLPGATVVGDVQRLYLYGRRGRAVLRIGEPGASSYLQQRSAEFAVDAGELVAFEADTGTHRLFVVSDAKRRRS